MSKDYSAHIRKINKIANGEYLIQRYSLGFYIFKIFFEAFMFICFFWIIIPFKLIFGRKK